MKIKNLLRKYKAIIIIIIALIVAGTNYLLYPTFIKKDMNLIEVPIALETIKQGTQINKEQLTTKLTNKDMIPENVVFNSEDIVNKYVVANYTIPEGGFIYKESITEEKQALGNVYYALDEGQIAYTIKVGANQYKDGKFKSNQLIDIYFRAEIPQTSGQDYLVGKLDDNVKIVNITGDDDLYITVSLNEDDLRYYLLAEKVGEIIPVIEVQDDETNNLYSIDALRQYLETKGSVLTLPEQEEIEVLEEDSKVIDKPKGSPDAR